MKVECARLKLSPILAHLGSLAYKPRFFDNKDVAARQDPSMFYKENFSMIFPPPNVTGDVHLGHALTATIQDVMVRWKQKQNFRTRWIPGMDHAGIATQVVVEKMLFKKLGLTRHDMGREKFLSEVLKWKAEKSSSITEDLKKLGTSFDWEKEYFTMDSNLSNAVNEAFVRMFDKGLIYRDKSLVNWSCSLESAISDVEVEELEIHGKTEVAVPNYEKNIEFGIITDIAYKVVDSDQEVIVSTTRPETLLGDVAVAVHPKDNRYSHLRDTKLWHPFRKEAIPLIFDEFVDPDFGTGAVKITPAHDKNDFEVGKRHNLRSVQVINEKGMITQDFEQFAGLPRFVAREKLMHSIAELELYRGSTFQSMVLPICSRSKDVVEFLLRPQWFVKCAEMSRKAVEVVESGELIIHPKTFEKDWNRWLMNCHDWCISRQLWWGHRIPAYLIKSGDKETWIAARSQSEAEEKFKTQHPSVSSYSIERDQDVLDTWFSSGLLPFSVFNWPATDDDFKKFFPLSILETGHDILFFWVARMVMLSMELTGKVPFKEVLLHGIICDSYGRKMSKSLGNVLSPDHVIYGASLEKLQNETRESVEKGIISQKELEKSLDGQKKMFQFGIKECGVDALRFTLLSHNLKQHFITFEAIECHTNTKFFNKIFNSCKFVTRVAENEGIIIKDIKSLNGLTLSEMDRWLLSRLGNTVKTMKSSMNNYNFHLATAALKTFFYTNVCDVFVETMKAARMKKQDEIKVSCKVLNAVLGCGLDYLEVFTPFIVTELKQHLPENCLSTPEEFIDDELEKRIETLLELCENIRAMKAECRITNKIPVEVTILVKSPVNETFFVNHIDNIKMLVFCSDVSITTDAKAFEEEYFVGTSTSGHLCSFGVRAFDKTSGKADSAMNQKKFAKLESELHLLLRNFEHEGYHKNVKDEIKKKHLERVRLDAFVVFVLINFYSPQIETIKLELESIKRMYK